jgi:hypothetical protein
VFPAQFFPTVAVEITRKQRRSKYTTEYARDSSMRDRMGEKPHKKCRCCFAFVKGHLALLADPSVDLRRSARRLGRNVSRYFVDTPVDACRQSTIWYCIEGRSRHIEDVYTVPRVLPTAEHNYTCCLHPHEAKRYLRRHSQRFHALTINKIP